MQLKPTIPSFLKRSRKPSHSSTTLYQLTPRKVAFGWGNTPLEWIPGHPFASHFINEINLILPAGEFWFCQLFKSALPHITDDKLRQDVQDFVRQESMHARAHGGAVKEYLNSHQVETETVTRKVDWLFKNPLADKPFGNELPNSLKHRWLVFRVGLIAAIEHTTCVLGKYVLENKRWDEVGADEVLLDLLRWHGAEEVEHRNVAFDLYKHLGGGYPSRYLFSIVATVVIFCLWVDGAAHLMSQDKAFAKQKPSIFKPWIWLEWQRTSRSGMLPSLPWIILQQVPFFTPWYDPTKEASTEDALAYLNSSPAYHRAQETLEQAPRAVSLE
jgi:predicted metal-dependent hydrolase